MKNLTCVIVEDEKPAARRLARLVTNEGLTCLAQLNDVKSAIDWFKKNDAPEVIFLDIQLSDGLSFEIFEHIEIKSPIIFTTAYDEYALKAFKLNSVDYLLKPIDKEELSDAIQKLKSRNQSFEIDLTQLSKIMSLNASSIEYKNRFTVTIGKNLKSITTDEIELFYSSNKATYVLTRTGRSYLLDEALDQLENQLSPEQFFRISRKYILKHSAIQQIISYSNSRYKVELNTPFNELIIVSRERVKSFKEWLG